MLKKHRRRIRNKKVNNEDCVKQQIMLAYIMKQKNWPEMDDFSQEKYFDRFWKRLEEFSSEQRKLILSLTKNFLWITGNKYLSEMSEIVNELLMFLEKNKCYKKVVFCPLLKKEDFNGIKSSQHVFYEYKVRKKVIEEKLLGYNIKFVDRPNELEDVKDNGVVLVLVDDFIGSGNTAVSAIKYIIDNFKLDTCNIVVLSIVAMECGFNKIINLGCEVITRYAPQKRGISDNGNYGQKEVNIMEGIEKQLKVSSNFQFGYEQSESLVCMEHVPNNTFPFYWWDAKNIAKPWFDR